MRILKNVISSILVMFMFLYGINVNVKANSDEIAKLNMNETYSNIDLTAVTNFNTQIMGANLVKLSWNAVKGADGYIIYRKIADGKFEYRYMVSNTTYTDTTAQTGEYNFYRVYPYKNVNGKRVLGPSNEYKYVKPAPLGVKFLKHKQLELLQLNSHGMQKKMRMDILYIAKLQMEYSNIDTW